MHRAPDSYPLHFPLVESDAAYHDRVVRDAERCYPDLSFRPPLASVRRLPLPFYPDTDLVRLSWHPSDESEVDLSEVYALHRRDWFRIIDDDGITIRHANQSSPLVLDEATAPEYVRFRIAFLGRQTDRLRSGATVQLVAASTSPMPYDSLSGLFRGRVTLSLIAPTRDTGEAATTETQVNVTRGGELILDLHGIDDFRNPARFLWGSDKPPAWRRALGRVAGLPAFLRWHPLLNDLASDPVTRAFSAAPIREALRNTELVRIADSARLRLATLPFYRTLVLLEIVDQDEALAHGVYHTAYYALVSHVNKSPFPVEVELLPLSSTAAAIYSANQWRCSELDELLLKSNNVLDYLAFFAGP
jgi:hypothetical protein